MKHKSCSLQTKQMHIQLSKRACFLSAHLYTSISPAAKQLFLEVSIETRLLHGRPSQLVAQTGYDEDDQIK